MDKLLFKRILIAAISILAAVYVAYLLISTNFKIYPTENAVETTVTDKIYSNAFIIRDETYIYNNTSKVLSYVVNDGDEVGIKGEIAKVYDSEDDAAAQTKADALEKKLADLQNLQKTHSSSGVGIETINSEINNNIISFLGNLNEGNIISLENDTNNLLYSINQSQAYTGKISNFNSEISEIQAQINNLRGSSDKSTGVITTDKAGYFSAHCDGYENLFKYKDIDKLKLSDLNKIKKTEVSANVAGKVISSLNWYVACKISADEAINLSLWNGGVTMLFSDALTDYVPAEIYKIQQDSNKSDALLILKCSYMNEALADIRQEPIEIGLGTYKGLRVSKKAIHDDYIEKISYDNNGNQSVEKKKVQGVYVLYGSEVQFKEISIIYSGNDYVLCDESPDSDILFNGETVSMYDQIILEGDDLYDGKVIE